MDSTVQSVDRRTLATYAIGSLGTGGFATLPGLVLLYFLTDTLGVTALAAGLVLAAAKIWDVLIDPVIGNRSDHSLATTGSRRRYMLIGSVALPLFFFLTFAVPAGLGPIASAGWVFVAFLCSATAFSLFQVPYIALPAELATGYDDRIRLLTWRVVVLTLAILLFGAGGPLLRGLGDDPRIGYLIMAGVAGLVLGAGMLVTSSVAPKDEPIARRSPALSPAAGYRSALDTLRRSSPFRALLGTFVLQGLATGMMLAGAQYVATWVLRSEDAVTPLFVALIAPALLLAPVWGRFARRVGKERAFALASSLFGVAALALLGLLWAPGMWVYAPVALAGAAYAGMQSLPMAMLPDVISHDARTNGEGHAGSFSGVWTAGETAGMAFGATVLSVILAVTGYTERVAGQSVEQSSSAIVGIVLSFSVVPALLLLASLFTLRRYRLRKVDIDVATAPAGRQR
ncbi:MFS transporter [Mycetocola sp.]|uniref:MFS transporter n=1 Tax=Mycetocola sp. TaxID=1871042 RepID=UPI00398A3996